MVTQIPTSAVPYELYRICFTICDHCDEGIRTLVPPNVMGRVCPSCGYLQEEYDWELDHWLTAMMLSDGHDDSPMRDMLLMRGRFKSPTMVMKRIRDEATHTDES